MRRRFAEVRKVMANMCKQEHMKSTGKSVIIKNLK